MADILPLRYTAFLQLSDINSWLATLVSHTAMQVHGGGVGNHPADPVMTLAELASQDRDDMQRKSRVQ